MNDKDCFSTLQQKRGGPKLTLILRTPIFSHVPFTIIVKSEYFLTEIGVSKNFGLETNEMDGI